LNKFQIKSQSNGNYYFVLKAGNGETILTSEGYVYHQGCLNGIQSVKINSPYDSRYERKFSSNGQYYFNLTAPNGQVIGVSEMYTTSSGRDNGIESVKRNAPNAPIEDLTKSNIYG